MTLKMPLEMLYHWEATQPTTVYLRQPINGKFQEYTWADTANLVRRVAAALKAMDLPRGSNIAILSKNCAEWFITDLAIMMAGHVSVPIYFTASNDTISYILDHSGCKVIFLGKLDDMSSQLNAIPENITKISFPYEVAPDSIRWEQLLAQPPIKENISRTGDETMTIVYTSGSTGQPKGIVNTFNAFAWSCQTLKTVIPASMSDRVISYLPLAHITERVFVEGSSFYNGYNVSFVENLDSFASDVKSVQPTMFLSVPRLWIRFQMGVLAKLPQKKLDLLLKIPLLGCFIAKKVRKELGLNSTFIWGSGAAPISAATLRWYHRLGIDISEGWGMSENNGLGTICYPFRTDKLGSIGRPVVPENFRISDEGEIQVCGPNLMKEYYLAPELTAEAYTEDGWLKTGDKARMDDEGYVFITGRLKEIFKTSKGKYVAPVPIEALLMENSFIEQVCVTGSNLKQPLALLVLTPEALQEPKDNLTKSLSDTLEQVNARLEGHEKLDTLIVMNEDWTTENGLLTPTLKIKRTEVEKRYQETIDSSYSSKVVFV